jgi:WD40 repeat protein
MVSCADGNIIFINLNILRVCKSVQFGSVGICDFQIIEEQYLLMGCEDGKARMWKFCTENRCVLNGHAKAVIGIIVIDKNQNFIVTASKDCSLKIWEKFLNYDYE